MTGSIIPKIQMVDLHKQYLHLKSELDAKLIACIESTAFINGPQVAAFQESLEQYLGVKHVIPCANGTDALQVALMALNLKRGDEIIVPAFTYVATAEVIALLGLKPIMVDVDASTFNITSELVKNAITPKTKAIVPVHLFGQSVDMDEIMAIAKSHNLWVIEDNAQAIGADYCGTNGETAKTGTIGHIGCTSFFPSKNLGCYGDGGAMMTNDDDLAEKLRMIVNHGQKQRYYHSIVGVNSRLDAIQAVILNTKLKYLDKYNAARKTVADGYDKGFAAIPEVETPVRSTQSTHVFHQYTLKIKSGKRQALQNYLQEKAIPSMIYYPVPLYKQEAFKKYVEKGFQLPITEQLCQEVVSLPIHTEMDDTTMDYIVAGVQSFFQ